MSIQQIRDDVARLNEAVFGGGKVSKDQASNEAAHSADRAAAIIQPQDQVGQTEVPAAEDIPVVPDQTEGAGVQGEAAPSDTGKGSAGKK